jgi:hypothetical protein
MRFCWLLLLGIAGCSPYKFAPEVTAFSSGVDKVSQGFNAGTAALATDRTTQVILVLENARAPVAKSPSCEVPVSKGVAGSAAPCLIYRRGGAPSQPSEVEVQLGRTREVLAALQAYAQALAAVTNAADRSAYDAAVGKLASALGALAAAAGPSGAAAGKGVSAGVNIIGWLIGEQLDYQRFEVLKASVNAVGTAPAGGDSAMKVITDAIGKGMLLARDQQLTILNQDLDFDTARLGPSESDAAYDQRLADAETLAGSIQALRTADPLGTAVALNTAHVALVKAVNDPSRELPALLTALQQFGDKAEALQGAFSAGAAPHAAAPPAKPATTARKGS